MECVWDVVRGDQGRDALAVGAEFPLLEHENPESLRNSQTHIANQVSVNLLYCLHKGTVIEATPALESLLANSDVDLSLPMSMVAPPYAA
jgi:hypothetical protein